MKKKDELWPLWLVKTGIASHAHYELLMHPTAPVVNKVRRIDINGFDCDIIWEPASCWDAGMFELLFPALRLRLGQVCEVKITKIKGGHGIVKVTK